MDPFLEETIQTVKEAGIVGIGQQKGGSLNG